MRTVSDERPNAMLYRDQTTVHTWVADFLVSETGAAPDISVVDQYFTEGPDSGLVVVQLRTASTVTSIVPTSEGGTATWRVQFEPRDETISLDGDQIASLAADLTTLSRLCRYLQARTDATD
ncbi:hypothetical protein GCM10009808_17870 [Microbacterium sediminicola]|uniref:Polyketide cyclase / dehydrase and lipid transport n=1 Tax=Microbacterium sediminicola TaxID=415210 RepID=A0ABN2I9D3_9MICO